jgi:copper(I)-binding protein
MIESRRLYNACFHAAVAGSQAFIVVVAGRRDRAARASVHAITEPSGIAQMRHARHRYFCGTNLPSSMCAGS